MSDTAECLGPYSIAGPLEPTVHYIQPPSQANIPPSSSSGGHFPPRHTGEPHAGYNERKALGAPYAGYGEEQRSSANAQLSPEEAAAIAGGFLPVPKSLGGTEELAPQQVSNLPPESSGVYSHMIAGLSEETQKMYTTLWISTVLGITYAGLLAPTAWVSFTARAAVMRHWYGALVPAAVGWFLSTQIFFVVMRMPVILSFILSKFCAVGAGFFGFRRPETGWVIGFLASGFIVGHILRIILSRQDTRSLWCLSSLLLVVFFLSELWFVDATQTAITALTSAFMSTASLSFLLTYFGLQLTSPFDFFGFWNLSASELQLLDCPKMLLSYWILLTIIGSLFQTLRTKQGRTIPFPTVGSAILGYSKPK